MIRSTSKFGRCIANGKDAPCGNDNNSCWEDNTIMCGDYAS